MGDYRLPREGEQPRTNFCWICSRKLYKMSFVLLKTLGGEVVTHLVCAKNWKSEYETITSGIYPTGPIKKEEP